jgi:hypothetical protein
MNGAEFRFRAVSSSSCYSVLYICKCLSINAIFIPRLGVHFAQSLTVVSSCSGTGGAHHAFFGMMQPATTLPVSRPPVGVYPLSLYFSHNNWIEKLESLMS